MGAQVSTQEQEIINEMKTNLKSEVSNLCSNVVRAVNVLKIPCAKEIVIKGVDQDIQIANSFKCVSTIKSDNSAINKLTNQLEQLVKQKQDGLTIGQAQVDTSISKIRNVVTTTLDAMSQNSAENSLFCSNVIEASSEKECAEKVSVESIKQRCSIDNTFDAALSSDSVIKAWNQVVNKSTQQTDQTQLGLLNTTQIIAIVVGLVVAVIVLVIILVAYCKSDAGKCNEYCLKAFGDSKTRTECAYGRPTAGAPTPKPTDATSTVSATTTTAVTKPTPSPDGTQTGAPKKEQSVPRLDLTGIKQPSTTTAQPPKPESLKVTPKPKVVPTGPLPPPSSSTTDTGTKPPVAPTTKLKKDGAMSKVSRKNWIKM